MRFVVLLLLSAACDNRSRPPPSSETAPSGLPQGEVPAASAPRPTGGGGGDPHAGLEMEDPHGGMGGMGGMGSPHGEQPSAPVDPNMVLEGTIEVAAKLKDQVKPGDIMFLSVKSVDASGTPQRIPLAVDRQDAAGFPMAFSLSGKNTMMPGTKFEGDVAVIVRVDRDGEATTRAKGDIEGQVRAKIPARGLKIVLDTPVP